MFYFYLINEIDGFSWLIYRLTFKTTDFSVTAGSNEITALRPPRVIFADNIVRPYSFKIAAGSKIFKVELRVGH